jgi:hypothetical protein
MAQRTLTTVRQAVYAALTSPQLTYAVGDGPEQTLPIASVLTSAPGGPAGTTMPDPFVCFSVGGRGTISQNVPARIVRVRVWCGSSASGDLATDLYEAVRARLIADGDDAAPIIAAANGVISDSRERYVWYSQYDATLQRWVITAMLWLVAV